MRASRTAAARRRSVPWTTKSFSVVRMTCVRSQSHTDRTTIRAARSKRTAPTIVAGQPTATAKAPGTASATARTNAPASTIPCRRSSTQTCSRADPTKGLQDSPRKEESLGHERDRKAGRGRHAGRDRLGGGRARAVEAQSRSRPRLPRHHHRRGDAARNRLAPAPPRAARDRTPRPLRRRLRPDRPSALARGAARPQPGRVRARDTRPADKGIGPETCREPFARDQAHDPRRDPKTARASPPRVEAVPLRRQLRTEGIRDPDRDLLHLRDVRLLYLRALPNS